MVELKPLEGFLIEVEYGSNSTCWNFSYCWVDAPFWSGSLGYRPLHLVFLFSCSRQKKKREFEFLNVNDQADENSSVKVTEI